MKYIVEYNSFNYKYKPSIEFVSPSENDSIVYVDYISVEARVKYSEDSKIWLKVNKNFQRNDVTVVNGKLFANIKLREGVNEIKIVASNNAGYVDSVRKVVFAPLPKLEYTDVENYKVMDCIRAIIKEYYNKLEPFKSNKIYNIAGKIINTEYLSKWLNNRTFREVITKDFNLSPNYQDLINFLIENKYDIFNMDGKYFDIYYKIMEVTTLKGKDTEKRSLIVFGDFVNSRGIAKVVEFIDPTTEEDKKGIDSFALLDNGSRVTIQVKPLSKVKSNTSDYVELISAGDVRKITTQFLIVANDKSYFIIQVPLKKLSKEYLESEKSDDESLDEINLPDFETRDSDKVIRFSKKYLLFEKHFK